MVLDAQGTPGPRTAWQRFIGLCPLRDAARLPYLSAVRHIALHDLLVSLGDEWVVIDAPSEHVGPVPAAFTLIGPAGIVTISSGEASPGTASAARALGYRTALSRALDADVPVTALHVGRRTAPDRDDVTAVHAGDLVAVISDLPGALTPTQVSALTTAVAGSITGAAAPRDLSTFAELRDEVHTARRTRQWWTIGLTALAVITAVAGAIVAF